MFAYFYLKYSRVVDRRMAGGIFSNAAKIYARPQAVAVGEKLEPADVASNFAAPAIPKVAATATRPSAITA